MDKSLSPAQLVFNADTPVSTHFDDFYFSSDDGVAESQYNFIEGNNLAQRLSESTPTLFTIAETGFGTGLNFLLTAQLWQQVAPKSRTLHYISAEKHPLDKYSLHRIYQQQGWENSLSEALLENYPPLNVGAHTLSLSKNITLTLLLGDALTQLSNADFIADAWFLDGFAPAKNPDMWSSELCQCFAAHSRAQTTFATFTAASMVRKNLLAAGFVVNKTSGFGKKRERLLGYFANNPVDS